MTSCSSEDTGQLSSHFLQRGPDYAIYERYVFASADRARLQEIGPRFTLKLRYIKKGTPAVHQLGAQPPRLQFDAEADEAEEEGNEPSAGGPERSQPDEGVLSSGEEDASSSALGSTPKPSSSLTKDEEYIWKWKVISLPVEQSKFLICHPTAKVGNFQKDVLPVAPLPYPYTLLGSICPDPI